MKTNKSGKRNVQELRSLNQHIYDMFSVAELERRLQMSAVAPWTCMNHSDCPLDACPNNGCSPVMIDPIPPIDA
jgi:hypothetical protein